MAQVLISTIDVEGAGTVEIYAEQVGTDVQLTVKLSDDWNADYNIDLNGIFLDYATGGSNKLSVDGEKANALTGTSDESGAKILWDWAASLGSKVGGSDGITDNTVGTATLANTTLADLDGALVGIRATSTGLDGEGSLKLVGEIDVEIPTGPDSVPDSYPTWPQDISNVVLYFQQSNDGSVDDGWYVVKFNVSGDVEDDLDLWIDDALAWLVANDANIDANSVLSGAVIKGGSTAGSTQYYANDGDDGTNDTVDVDAIPAGAPGIVYPPPQGNVDGDLIDVTYTVSWDGLATGTGYIFGV